MPEKTTKLMEMAVRLLGEMPENCKVYITGAHSKWLVELEREFKAAGLTDVVFLLPNEIMNGRLNGVRGVLLIDDAWALPPIHAAELFDLKARLKANVKWTVPKPVKVLGHIEYPNTYREMDYGDSD